MILIIPCYNYLTLIHNWHGMFCAITIVTQQCKTVGVMDMFQTVKAWSSAHCGKLPAMPILSNMAIIISPWIQGAIFFPLNFCTSIKSNCKNIHTNIQRNGYRNIFKTIVLFLIYHFNLYSMSMKTLKKKFYHQIKYLGIFSSMICQM